MDAVNDRRQLVTEFACLYGNGGSPLEMFFCPGRVNLIGEHIDYNGGLVFPVALTLGIYGLLRRRDDRIIRLHSLTMPGTINVEADGEIVFDKQHGWGNYAKGVIRHLRQAGYTLCGADVLFASTLPMSAGLSSSAALEVLTGYMMLRNSGQQRVARVPLALLCQQAENKFIGVQCGIMDQFAVAVSKKDQALCLDCRAPLHYHSVPFVLSRHCLVIMNTNKPRTLADSKYNERRSECERARDIISAHRHIDHLCQATMEEINGYVGDDTLRRRARHVVSENERVRHAVSALKQGDLAAFGKLMIASHVSLRDDYEVTGNELDTVFTQAQKHPSCLGVRMTGAGFGGCAIALVEKSQVANFQERVSSAYRQQTGLNLDCYVSAAGDGVRKIGVRKASCLQDRRN